jgi:two-component system, NarL family, nitrate/nitrite response regulator NarL
MEAAAVGSSIVMPLERTTVFVADDHPVFRDGLIRALKTRPEFEVVGAAADGRQALDAIRELQPAVALLDVKMPGPRRQRGDAGPAA